MRQPGSERAGHVPAKLGQQCKRIGLGGAQLLYRDLERSALWEQVCSHTA